MLCCSPLDPTDGFTSMVHVTWQPITGLNSLCLHVQQMTTGGSDWLQHQVNHEHDVIGGRPEWNTRAGAQLCFFKH